MAESFTLAWDRRDNCRAEEVIGEALTAADLDCAYDEDDPQQQTAYEDAAAAVDSCPRDRVEWALEHLRRAANNSDLAHQMLTEAVDQLDWHAQSCDCADQAWAEFRDELSEALDGVGSDAWLVRRGDSGPALDDIWAELDADLLLTTCLPDPTESPELVDCAWDEPAQTLRLRVTHEGHRLDRTLVALDDDDAALAGAVRSHLEPEEPAAAARAAHQVMAFPGPVRAVAAALNRNEVRQYLTAPHRFAQRTAQRGWKHAPDLLHQVRAAHRRLDPRAWEALTRMAPGWAGSLAELTQSAQAVLTAPPA